MDEFYILKNERITDIRKILSWADKYGRLTSVTMIEKSSGIKRSKSDKKFNEVLKLINSKRKPTFRIILRRKMNLFLLLYSKRVVRDMLEIFVRGIKEGSKEYFITILLEKKKLNFLQAKYELKKI